MRATPATEPHPEPRDDREQRPPGEFVSDQLQSECSRFLAATKDVVKRRTEAGLTPSRG